ncbi:MAG: hypothetical protein K8R75_04700 [Deltaproteobacteria bacterium]|nr:hypothetical protein [Deltaproteobacteria bacterium]
MRGGGYADVLPVFQVPDNKADAVPLNAYKIIYMCDASHHKNTLAVLINSLDRTNRICATFNSSSGLPRTARLSCFLSFP